MKLKRKKNTPVGSKMQKFFSESMKLSADINFKSTATHVEAKEK